MKKPDYPALYIAADAAALSSQREYLGLLVAQYVVLLTAAIFGLKFADGTAFYVSYAALFFISLLLIGLLASRKPEQDWYRARALAESVKTLTWRFMMGAEPYHERHNEAAARMSFKNILAELLKANEFLGRRMSSDVSEGEQITKEMKKVRDLPLDHRKKLYLENRIREQRAWYARKAHGNQRSYLRWISLAAAVVIVSGLVVLSRIGWKWVNVDFANPLIVLSTSIFGWIQVKKFTEVSSAYILTAHEIGLAQAEFDDIGDEAAWAAFVANTELVFSREHTQWVARQGTAS